MSEFVNVNDITITSLETIDAFDIMTGAFLFTLDELQNVSIAQTQDKNDITGRQGRKISSLKRNKAVTVSGTNGLVSAGLLEMQTGSAFENKPVSVKWTDYLTVSGNASATNFKAIGTEGNEIEYVYVKNTDGTISERLEQDAEVSEGKFTYNPATKVLSFNDGDYENGTEIVVYYNRKIQANTQENMSDHYSNKCMLYVNGFAEDKCSRVYRVQIFIPKSDFNGEFTLEFGENQSVHAFEAESLAGACGTNGALWTYTLFGADSEDVA